MSRCPVFNAADVLGKRWTIPLLQQVGLNGSSGFNALHRRLRAVSPKVLSQRLSELESLGVVAKQAHGRRSAYALTAKGKELTAILDSLRHWHDRHSGSARCLGRDCTACPLYA